MMSGNIRTSGLQKHSSFLDSTNSECYELDLPAVPAAIRGSPRYQTPPQRLPLQAPPQQLPLQAQSPLYSNVKRAGLADALSPMELSTIEEVQALTINDNASLCSDDDLEDVGNLRKGVTKTANRTSQGQSRAYTALHQSTITDPNVYEVPNHETTNLMDSERSYVKASPALQTSYVKMPQDRNEERPTSWVRRTIHRTFRYRYRMEMVGMKKCCAGSHSGAKKFCTLLGVILVITLIAVLGTVIASSSWFIMRDRANMIEGELDTYITSLRSCRIGRNWNSVPINSSSGLLGNQISEETLNIPLSNITRQALGMDVNNLTASQLLLYIVIRSNNVSNCNAPYDEMDAPSYINVALWTKSEASGRQFRQYMAILNDKASPQIVTRSFWFPLVDTDNHFYARAQLMELNMDEEEELTPLNLSVFLAGYC